MTLIFFALNVRFFRVSDRDGFFFSPLESPLGRMVTTAAGSVGTAGVGVGGAGFVGFGAGFGRSFANGALGADVGAAGAAAGAAGVGAGAGVGAAAAAAAGSSSSSADGFRFDRRVRFFTGSKNSAASPVTRTSFTSSEFISPKGFVQN